jgi:hypothetical protein
LLVLLLILGLAPGAWLRERPRPRNAGVTLGLTPLQLPPAAKLAPHLGAFALQRAWVMTGDFIGFGGYSALLPQSDGRLLAIGDNGRWLRFAPPGRSGKAFQTGFVVDAATRRRRDADTEAATQDPATGTIWVAREDSNAISRHDPQFRTMADVRPPAMRGWPDNKGPEAMVRLADGRFIVLAEAYDGLLEARRHQAVLFAHDPLAGGEPVRFTFAGTPEFRPTDMAALPDGRVLILMRRLVWPLPLRFAGRILIADPAAIRPGSPWRGVEVARLPSSLPVDNFEGMAVAPRPDGRLDVWLISDANHAATQRTLLWKLSLDPARLPDTRGKARD